MIYKIVFRLILTYGTVSVAKYSYIKHINPFYPKPYNPWFMPLIRFLWTPCIITLHYNILYALNLKPFNFSNDHQNFCNHLNTLVRSLTSSTHRYNTHRLKRQWSLKHFVKYDNWSPGNGQLLHFKLWMPAALVLPLSLLMLSIPVMGLRDERLVLGSPGVLLCPSSEGGCSGVSRLIVNKYRCVFILLYIYFIII